MRRLAYIFVVLLALVGCEGIDCTLNNVVALNVGFYSSASGSAVYITDTLTVTAEGTDSVLLNRAIGVSTLALPMSYWRDCDTLNLQFCSAETAATYRVVLRIGKTNRPHYESPDCPTTMFHEVTAVDYDDALHLIDSIAISHADVNYAAQENIKIYLRTAAE